MTSDQRGELYRGGIHAVLIGWTSALFLYQLMRIAERGPERHLIVNAIVYLPLAGFEGYQTWRHWRYA